MHAGMHLDDFLTPTSDKKGEKNMIREINVDKLTENIKRYVYTG